MDNFDLIDDKLFEALSNPINIDELNIINKNDIKYYKCPDCNDTMESIGIDYQCKSCGLTVSNGTLSAHGTGDSNGGSIKVTTGASRGKYRNVNSNYSKTQKKNILSQLYYQQEQFTGAKFPRNVLNAAAEQYNLIQKKIKLDIDTTDEKLDGTDKKKFVRRGNMKDEILAALIYFEGIRENNIRKRKDIAVFMGLSTCGFSRGEDIIRDLEAEGHIDIPVDDEPIDGFAGRYLEALEIDNIHYVNFIIDIVQRSNEKKIGMGSQISSKVVGAIWAIIVKLGLEINAHQLEKCADNTKKNTFIKFYKLIDSNINLFADIFRKYEIPY